MDAKGRWNTVHFPEVYHQHRVVDSCRSNAAQGAVRHRSAGGVKLEVLDWGGSEQPLVFLPALGDTAHAFDIFAPKFTGENHAYGITLRDFGESSYPTPDRTSFSSDRLSEDVLAVMDTVHLNKPVLISHSIGGEQLSSVGIRYLEKVSGLIYLESSGYYMHYDAAIGDRQLDLLDTRDKIDQILPYEPTNSKEPIEALLATLPQLEKDLQAELQMKHDIPPLPESAAPRTSSDLATQGAFAAIFNGERKYTRCQFQSLLSSRCHMMTHCLLTRPIVLRQSPSNLSGAPTWLTISKQTSCQRR